MHPSMIICMKHACLFIFIVTILSTTCAYAVTVTIHTASGDVFIQAEVASDDAKRARGLMNRKTMAPDGGMLFLYPSPRIIAMWMKNTQMPLDIIYIDESWTIAYMVERAMPHDLTPRSSQTPIIAALEIHGGMIKTHSIDIGNTVTVAHE